MKIRNTRLLASALALCMIGPVMAADTPQGPDPLSPIREGRTSPFAGLSTEETVQQLADREEIRELIAIYAHRAALGISIADMFTDDGGFVVRIPGREPMVSRGREQLDETYRMVAARPGSQLPMLHNVALDIEGDEARGVASIEIRGDAGGQNIIAAGYYKDSFRREDGRWKFVTRDVTFFHYTTLERGWAEGDAGRE